MICSIEGCNNPVKYRGLCGKHYKRAWRHGDPTRTLIDMTNPSCIVEGCKKAKRYSSGYCNTHHLRMERYGRLERIKAPDGAGGINMSGYRVITVYGIRVYEHIYLAEKALGKKLPLKAIVHHLNNKPADNYTPLNLIICPNQAYHLLLHRRAKELGYE